MSPRGSNKDGNSRARCAVIRVAFAYPRRLAMKRFSVYRIDLYIAQFFTFDAP
jgi:hypothetical protein